MFDRYKNLKDKEFVFNIDIKFNTRTTLTPRILEVADAFDEAASKVGFWYA